MSSSWIAAFVLLGLLCLLNTAVLVGLLRQVGVLHQRVRPLGPGTHEGPQPGNLLPSLAFEAVQGRWPASQEDEQLTVWGVVSPGCEMCNRLPGFLLSEVGASRAGIARFVLVTNDSPTASKPFIREHNLEDVGSKLPLVRHASVLEDWGVPGTPYVIASTSIGSEELVRAAGVINTLEQFEELMERAYAFEIDWTDSSASGSHLDQAALALDSTAIHGRAS